MKIDERYLPGGSNSEKGSFGPLANQGRSKFFGQVSYPCEKGKHTSCTKLSCPCKCHQNEDE